MDYFKLGDDAELESLAKELLLKREGKQALAQSIQTGPGSIISDILLGVGGGLVGGLSGQSGYDLADKAIGAKNAILDKRLKALDDSTALKAVMDLSKARQANRDRLAALNVSMRNADVSSGDRRAALGQTAAENEKNRANQLKIAGMRKRDEGANGKRLPPDKVLSVNEGNTIPTLLSDISKTIENNQDSFGPVSGRLSVLNPWDEKSNTIESQIRAASQAFGRFMEGGVLRKEDEDKYRKMFPNLSDALPVARNKLSIVNRLLSEKQNSNLKALKDAGYDVSSLDKGLTIPEVPSILKGNVKIIRGARFEKAADGKWYPAK